jgi:hypothetical protein
VNAKDFYKYSYSYCRQKRALGYKISTIVEGAGLFHALSYTRDSRILWQAALSLQMSEAVDWLAVKDGAKRYGIGLSGNWRTNPR